MKINYEFHITVKDVNKEAFISYCKMINIKPILLELQNSKNNIILHDTMTSHHKLLDNDYQAREELESVAFLLEDAGFEIVRKKIEADINHPDLKEDFKIDNIPNYFETHFNIFINDSEKEKLQEIAKNNNCHFSRNIFKKINDEYTIMITYRKYTGTIKEFQNDIHKIENDLKENNFKIEKVIVEYAIYDTKEDWDKEWLNSTPE